MYWQAILRVSLVGVVIFFLGCNTSSLSNAPAQENTKTGTPEQRDDRKESNVSQIIQGATIWSGEADGHKFWWTTRDLYLQSSAGVQEIWEPLVQKGFEDFIAVNSDDGSGKPLPVMSCSYERTFQVMSVVGTLVSFEDSYYVGCEREAHPSIETRFTTINLSKSGEVIYAREQDTPMLNVNSANLGKIVELTDYFTEADILRALLADRVVHKALNTVNANNPGTLAELVALFESNDYELGDSGYELRPDFLTRFTFHHVEGDQVAIRVALPPHYGANRAMQLQLGLLLPIPQKLQSDLTIASSRDHGFLMKDSKRIANGQVTTIKRKTNEHSVK